MTEAEWLASADPVAMLRQLRGRWSDRKERLFACACCRLIWHTIKPKASRQAVELAEAYVDGKAARGELLSAKAEAWKKVSTASSLSVGKSSQERFEESQALLAAAFTADPFAPNLPNVINAVLAVEPRGERIASLIRDVFGNPFQKPRLERSCLSWNERTVPKMAQSIYEDQAFAHLPILADALEDAGCTDSGMIEHCREEAAHVRGCWVLDMLLRRV